MALTEVGCEFPSVHLWHKEEQELLKNIRNNINIKYKDKKNLLIKALWFGPQYDNGEYKKSLLDTDYDNIFYLTAVDPVTLNKDQLTEFFNNFKNAKIFLLGNFDESKYNFIPFGNWAVETLKDIKINSLSLIKYKFLNYNRKPARHKVKLVELLNQYNLSEHGIITLNENINDDNTYGPANVWNHHFLNVVSETTFNWWDNIFVSEKTFKPIIGLRPFIINGNWRTYKLLRNHGFKTFNHYFPVRLENLHEDDVIPNIVKTVKWVCKQDNNTLLEMYNEMLPDLIHNRNRALEFSKEQKQKMENMLL